MQKLTIGIKLDDKITYLKTIEIQENSDKINRLTKVISLFIKHNFERGNERTI